MPLILLTDRQYTAPAGANAAVVTPAATAWANSAYVTLLDPTPAACVLTGVTLYTTDGGSSSANYDAEIDIATGAAGAEIVIATIRCYNVQIFAGELGPTNCCVLPIPIDNIPAGVRISTRLRKNSTSTLVWDVAITYLQKPLASPLLLTTAAIQKTLPPASAGITVTAAATAWTSGAWAQLRAASGAALVIVGVVFGTPSAKTEWELDLGTGTAGSEVVITTIRLATNNQGMPSFLMLPAPLDKTAASTRLAARLRSATVNGTAVVSLMVIEKPL